MRHTDVTIIGGGLAGATAAAMLGEAGIATVLVDPHLVYPPDFRCEKIDDEQRALLVKTGIADKVLPAMARADELWVGQYGHIIRHQPTTQHGMLYHDLVNTVRRAIPASVTIVEDKAAEVATSDDRQIVRTASGEEISSRLVVVATGLNPSLRHVLNVERRELSRCHSITVGFDIVPVGRAAFDFPALSYYAERPSDLGAYLTLFPIPGAMRANYMCYRGLDDPWIHEVRQDPHKALTAIMPNLERRIGRFAVAGQMRVRPADLYVTENYQRPGLILLGDAFSTSCPAAGTGSGKALSDVVCLQRHIGAWLATPGMAAGKIAAFYADPDRLAYHKMALKKAYNLKSLCIDRSPRWALARLLRFVVRGARGVLEGAPTRRPAAASVDRRAPTVRPV
jgi:2-polyprenyl-6-methoxyphenol hydroxylase-like FAD-dependent oxidoreductase